ncbi:berberine bridge enzyme-like 8 [Durio zibethinus]|uniref:Berberine bridge enzyme-like 8 n=1 Tax=Durio zibethinus TaxID=66656 RepID=A0A6P6A7Y3_DURZI|nr:berberine bridge enzyme-like 8 [Durio zibethinus]
MKSLQYSMFPFLFVALFSLSWATSSANTHEDFLHCLSSLHPEDSSSISKVIYTQTNSSYSSVLESLIHNSRFLTPTTLKPLVIVTPLNISHVQATIHCSKKHGLQTRTRSGGHDFEGLSYVSEVPFVIVDLFNFRSIDVDVENKVAWVQSGAIMGELYYKLAEKSRTLAFPGALGHSVGFGGFISGGGYGLLFRKYGLAADNIIDAQFIDVKGRVLDRKSMGEDLFWAIRGGGGGSFGIVLSWKIKLVTVPATVTAFSISRTLEQNATKLLHRWQYVAHKLPDDIYPSITIATMNSSQDGKRTVVATFSSLFLGQTNELIPLMQKRFPELGLVKEDCIEMSFVESIIFLGLLPNRTNILLDRSYRVSFLVATPSFKSKSDYVKKPFPEIAFQGIWNQLLEEEATSATLNFVAYGGKMDQIPATAIPFPHRIGNLYKISYNIRWREEDNINSQTYISWIRKLYSYMSSYVSKSPRTAYINYRDLDIGMNNIEGNTSYAQASVWGRKYFKKNFDRLVRVKTMIDPENFFKHEQSIPPFFP